MDEIQTSEENLKPRAACTLSVFIIFVLLVAVIYFFYSQYLANPCKVPVKYAIGDVDPRFKISSSEVKIITEDAVNRWNLESGENVLAYDPSADLKINLIYDERQAKVDKLNSEVATLDSSGNAIETARSKLQSMISSYENDLNDYNSTVAYWNARGGAPNDQYNQLQDEKNSLEIRRNQINDYSSLINSQINEHNSNLDQVNQEIDADKNTIITSGLYYPAIPKIDIFTFGNEEELRLVLMHELGHAISLDHDVLNTSIMYPVLGEQNLSNPNLSQEDLILLNSTCKKSFSPIKFFQKLFQVHSVSKS